MQDLPASLDIQAIVTNLSVFVLAVSAVVAGVYKAIKSIGDETGGKRPPIEQKVAAAMLVETATMAHWTESNRMLGEKLDRLCTSVVDLCHQTERLRDKMP